MTACVIIRDSILFQLHIYSSKKKKYKQNTIRWSFSTIQVIVSVVEWDFQNLLM